VEALAVLVLHHLYQAHLLIMLVVAEVVATLEHQKLLVLVVTEAVALVAITLLELLEQPILVEVVAVLAHQALVLVEQAVQA
jgi:hypothetical protein